MALMVNVIFMNPKLESIILENFDTCGGTFPVRHCAEGKLINARDWTFECTSGGIKALANTL